MAMVRYSPYGMGHMQQQVNRMLDQFDDSLRSFEGLGGGMFSPAMDVKENADAYVVHLEVPGVSQQQLDITMQDNILTIRGQKEQKQESGEGQFRRVERSYGSFARSLTLPRKVDSNAIHAGLNNGVLEVVLPKAEDAKPRQINVAVNSQTVQEQTAQVQTAETSGAQTTADKDAAKN